MIKVNPYIWITDKISKVTRNASRFIQFISVTSEHGSIYRLQTSNSSWNHKANLKKICAIPSTILNKNIIPVLIKSITQLTKQSWYRIYILIRKYTKVRIIKYKPIHVPVFAEKFSFLGSDYRRHDFRYLLLRFLSVYTTVPFKGTKVSVCKISIFSSANNNQILMCDTELEPAYFCNSM